jgi:hypothetical protein
MRSVTGTPAAIFLQLHPVASVLTVFLCDVVATFALGAFERHVDATITSHGHLSRFGERKYMSSPGKV